MTYRDEFYLQIPGAPESHIEIDPVGTQALPEMNGTAAFA